MSLVENNKKYAIEKTLQYIESQFLNMNILREVFYCIQDYYRTALTDEIDSNIKIILEILQKY